MVFFHHKLFYTQSVFIKDSNLIFCRKPIVVLVIISTMLSHFDAVKSKASLCAFSHCHNKILRLVMHMLVFKPGYEFWRLAAQVYNRIFNLAELYQMQILILIEQGYNHILLSSWVLINLIDNCKLTIASQGQRFVDNPS